MTFTEQSPPEPYSCTRKINNQMKRTLCGNLYSYHHMLSNMFEFDLEFEMSMDLVQWNIDLLNKVSKDLVGHLLSCLFPVCGSSYHPYW